MAAVFISYSSTDRERVLRIVGRLSRQAVDCWIDRNKIPGGSEWAGEITRNIKACQTLVLMATVRSLSSPNVGNEIGLAAKFGKNIMPVWLEPDLEYPDNVAYYLNGINYILAEDNEPGEDDENSWWRKLLDGLRQTNANVSKDPIEQQNAQLGTRSKIVATTALMPYLADRDEQERRISQQLELHIERNVRRPILFMLQGDQSQCIDGFIQRLERYTLPRHLTRLKLPDQLEWKNIFWPKASMGALASGTDDREQAYRAEIADKLDLGLAARPEEIVQQIAKYRQPVVFASMIYGEQWHDDEPTLLKDYRILVWIARYPERSADNSIFHLYLS